MVKKKNRREKPAPRGLMAVSSRQKGQNERRHDHLSSCVYIVEVLGDVCQHWNEVVELENRDEGYQRDKRE